MPEFSDYDPVYEKKARTARNSLSPDLRAAMDSIEDMMADDLKQLLVNSQEIAENIYIYEYADPNLFVTFKIDNDKNVVLILHLAVPKIEVSKKLFISYSHEDKKLFDELLKWLEPLEDANLISVWDDTKIKASNRWHDDIVKELDSARAAVLLVSQNFLQSEFINTVELPKLLDKAKNDGLQVFWIAASSSTIEEQQSPILQYQALLKEPPLDTLKPGKRNKELKRIHNEIKNAIETHGVGGNA